MFLRDRHIKITVLAVFSIWLNLLHATGFLKELVLICNVMTDAALICNGLKLIRESFAEPNNS